MEEYEDVYAYLEKSKYPESLTKDGKRNWRRKCLENFKVERGQLFFRKGQRKAVQEDVMGEREQQWKLCIKTSEEKERVMKSCHTSATGWFCIDYIPRSCFTWNNIPTLLTQVTSIASFKTSYRNQM